MTRFEQEISGLLDEEVAQRKGEPNSGYWKRNAEQELDKILKMINDGEMIIDEFGVATWKSNGRCIMSDMAEKVQWLQDHEAFLGTNIKFSKYATEASRDIELSKFAEEYRKQQANHKPSDEELFEMRAAFGRGAKVVNVITGQTITL